MQHLKQESPLSADYNCTKTWPYYPRDIRPVWIPSLWNITKEIICIQRRRNTFDNCSQLRVNCSGPTDPHTRFQLDWHSSLVGMKLVDVTSFYLNSSTARLLLEHIDSIAVLHVQLGRCVCLIDGCPSNLNLIEPILTPVRSQYADMSFLSGVIFLILKWTTLPSWPVTFKFMCSSLFFSSAILLQSLS